jgi:hypothetical protein
MAVQYLSSVSKTGAFSPDILALNGDTLPTNGIDGNPLPVGYKALLTDAPITWKIHTGGGTWTTLNNPATGAASGQVVSLASVGFDVATTITRPANTTPYTANDVLGGALDLGVLGVSAGPIKITGLELEGDIAAIPAGMSTFTLHMYNVTPPSAIADNGAWDLPAGDRASYLGNIPNITLGDLGSTLYGAIDEMAKQLRLAGTHVFGYLATVGAFTPAGNSEVYKLTMHTVAL